MVGIQPASLERWKKRLTFMHLRTSTNVIFCVHRREDCCGSYSRDLNSPKLVEMDGQPIPGMGGLACGSPFTFNKCGKSGIEVSEVFSKIGEHIDDAAVIRGLTTDVPAHEVATVLMNTGNLRLVRPSLGSWSVYGLGSLFGK